MKVIKNVRIYDYNNYIDNGYVVFDKQIIEVGEMRNYQDKGYEEINGKGKLLMPGLVNGHSHIYSTFGRGMNTYFNPNSFKQLLEQLWWKLDRNLDLEAVYYSALVSGVKYIQNGVTTIIDHHASGSILGSLNELKKGLAKIPLRAAYCFESSDRFDIDKCIIENDTFIKNNKTNFTQGMFGLHASFSLSEYSLDKISKFLDNNPIHIHVAESIEDQEHALYTYKERVIKRLNRHNLIHKNAIITHGIHLDEEEMDIIKEKEAVIAVNVTSNQNNAVGLPNIMKLKNHGIKVIIGNDGISQNIAREYQNVYFAMHHKSESPTGFSFDDLKELINNTYGYASDLLGVKLGKIEKGYEADLLLLDYLEPTIMNKDNVFGHMLFGLFNNYNPSHVFVEGNLVVDEFTIDENLINEYKKAKTIASRVWKKMEKEG